MTGDDFADDDAAVLAREQAAIMAGLREIPVERAALDERERERVWYARQLRIGWDAIGAAIGMTADAARKQYGEPPPDRVPF
jgi:hypothetical protein